MHLNITYEGDLGNATLQPFAETQTSTEAFGTVVVSVRADEPLVAGDNGAFSTTLDVTSEDTTQSMLLANMVVNWHTTDASGTPIENGTAEVRGNELTVEGIGTYDGRLVISLEPRLRRSTSLNFPPRLSLLRHPTRVETRPTRPTKPTRPRVQPSPTSRSPQP